MRHPGYVLQRNTHDADVADTWYHFRVAASCPPDKRIHIRPGYLLTGWYFMTLSDGGWVDAVVVDFSDGLDSISLSFTNANYYMAFILCFTYESLIDHGVPVYQGEWNDPIPYAVGVSTEYATAVEAEEYIKNLLSGSQEIQNGSFFPLCALIMRNDGTTGINGGILPIDSVNRGRSYIWLDCRPRHYLRA